MVPLKGWHGGRMADPKETLVRYLQGARDAVLWKLEGISEYDARRPLTPTGTNLLGLVKHLARGARLLRRHLRPPEQHRPALVLRGRRPKCGHVGHA